MAGSASTSLKNCAAGKLATSQVLYQQYSLSVLTAASTIAGDPAAYLAGMLLDVECL